MGLSHASDIEFIHLHYRLHHPVRFFEVGVAHQLIQYGGNNARRRRIYA
jgi:hypothetical protein